MKPTLRNLVPFVLVQDVERSIAFYNALGFETAHSHVLEGETRAAWVELVRHDARIMLALSSVPIAREAQTVWFYLYFDDIQAEHVRLAAAGLAPGELTYPFYNPNGEFRLCDPDGYCLLLC